MLRHCNLFAGAEPTMGSFAINVLAEAVRSHELAANAALSVPNLRAQKKALDEEGGFYERKLNTKLLSGRFNGSHA